MEAAGITREQITTALAAVPQLDVHATVPDQIVAGATWPVWARAEPEATMACLLWHFRWQVITTLPNGTQADSVAAGEQLLDAVATALYSAGMPLELVEPIAVQIAPGTTDTVPALRFTLAQ